MPIFEYNGKKYNVRDEHIDSFMKDFPDASTIMEREGKKYRVKSADYKTFMSEQQQPEQPAPDSTPETPATPTAGETPLTEQDKIRFNANIGQMKRRTEQMMDGFNEQMETMREYHDNAPLGGGQTAEGKMKFNPESGKLEKTYITPLGNRYTNKGLADMESFRYRQAADMSVGGQLRRARLKLAELQEKRSKRASEVLDETTEFNKTKLTGLGRALIGGQMYVGMQQGDRENSTLDVAIRQTEELIKDLEEQKDREQGVDVGFWRGFGRVAGDFRTWDFGMSDMRDALTMMNADDLKGENATEGEREAYNEMMGALYNKGQAEQMYGGNTGFWNRAGMMTGHMPAFMLDFGITGGGFNGINVLSKAGTKAATKVVGKETVEQMAEQGFKTYLKNNGVKGLGQYATNWTIKALGTTADDLLLRAPLMTNTVQAGKTTADIIDRKLGDVVVDENGNYDFSNDKTWGNAIWQGEANAIVENYSEMFGSHLDPVVTLGNMSKLANVVGAKRIGAVLSKADAGALNGIMGQTHQLFNKMGVSDYFGEVTEEYYGQLWRTMLNLDDAYQQNPDGTRTNLLATGQFHGDIWGGMALSMGLMGAGKATLSGAQYASMKHGVNKADARATELLGKEIWEPLRTTIDLTTNDDIGSVADGIVNDKNFSDDERAAILTYMERSLMMRGFNLGTLAQKRGRRQDEDVQSLDESYIDGYNIADPQEMTDAKNMRDYQRQRVSAIVDENTLGFLDAHPLNALEEMRSNGIWGESELETVLDYLNAKQVYEGMIQRVRDDIDARVEQSNAMVDARTNRTTGMIQGATMKQDDRRVYVVSGNLVLYADGSGIDNQASDGSIIVRDAETGALEQVSPDAVLNIDKPLNPSDEKMTAEDAIIQQFAQEASDKIDGVVTFNPGDTYTITGDDAQIQVQIIANEDGIVDNGDGTVNVSDGVNIFPLAKETIQQQADAANLTRVAQFEQQRTIGNAERKQEMQEAERPQYALNDIVSLTDENGVTVRGNITADADADGKYEVFTEAPINGKRVSLFTRDELDNMLLEHNGVAFEHPAENENNNGVENIPENDNNAHQKIPAMQRIPKDEQGNPLYEQTDSDTAWDAIVEQAGGDEGIAGEVAADLLGEKDNALRAAEKELKKLQEGKPVQKKGSAPLSMEERIAAKKAAKEKLGLAQANVDAARKELSLWENIASTPLRRKQEAEAERRRMADEAAALRKAEEEKRRAEREEAERKERETLNGVPDMVYDKPQDARARGYRRMNGHKIDRQEKLTDLSERELPLSTLNSGFNEELRRYREGAMDSNEMFHLGGPQGVMRMFLPDLPIVMRQRILNKGSVRKHNVAIEALADMPIHLSHPIFVFKRSDNALGVLTDMQDRDGKNVCVAIELKRQIQDGGEILEVNDIRSVHGRNVADIVYPIVQNGTLEWVDKEKGLAYLSSASRYVQQEIDKQDLINATKVVENFENPKPLGGKVPEVILGKEVSVKFSDHVLVGGRAAVIDANRLQPSHIQGVLNPLHFIDEAQPKERNDEASLLSSRKIAGNIRPEEITSSVTAYTGAPTVNARGEVIQGNNRSDALRQMWEYYPGQADIYKQYLKDHAEQFGLQAEDIEGMEHPVLVNMVDVDDAEAINLGQFVAQDTESGGIERIKPKNIMQKMGNDMRSFANLLLASSDEEISFAGLVDANGTNVLKWMMQKGYITPTQYSSAFDSKGNLTAEAKNDLRGIMYQSIFKGGSVRLEEMFNALPVKAQKAILATAFRDYDSPNAERMVEEIQNSIRAYYALSQDKMFAEAKNFKEARIAVESWKRQYQIDDATGESYLPADNFSNFALLLAAMYKGSSQGFMQGMFAEIYDLVQGTQEATLFEEPDNTPRTLTEAINEAVNKRNELLYGNEKFEYDGQRRSNVLAGGGAQGQREQQGSRGDAQAGERVEDGNETTERGGRIERDGGRSGVESEDRGNKEEENDETEVIGRSMTADEAQDFIADMELSAEIAPEIDLTIENWDALFGEDGIVSTPIGNVKMGENQFTKLMRQGRNGKLGMIKPTLEYPHAIVSDVSEAKEGDTTERASSYVFIRSFKKADGSRYYYFTSITVSKDGKEVVVSNQEKRRNAIANLLTKGKMVWKHADDVSNASDMAQGLYSPQGNVSDLATEGTDAPQTTMLSDNKGINNSRKSSELGEKIAKAEAEVDVNPTDKQKEAGNYKKGHVQVGTFDITIEQPKGSVRSGVDANGNKWETTMQNTYGYIRGTEGVDGDHIDVFLSDDIDGWNGRRVFVVDQYNEDGSFDEHKVMLGFNEADEAEAAYFANYDNDWAKKHKTVVTAVNLEDFEKWIDSSHRKTKAFAEYKGVNPLRTDHQGNPLNADGSLKVEKVGSVDELTDDDFLHPVRNVELPTLPEKVDAAIGVNGKPVVIKKNIFKKNRKSHKDLSPEQSRRILSDALYTPNMYGQNQKTKRPYNWILIHNAEKHSSVILEVSHLKDNIEIVNWHYLDDVTLKQKEKQAVAEGGLILTLESAVGNTHNDLSSEDKGSKLSAENQEKVSESSRPYSITPAQYTTKRGKVLDMQLVTLHDELSKDEFRSANAFAKSLKGWYDAKERGFLMRSKDDARALVETVIQEEDAVAKPEAVETDKKNTSPTGEDIFQMAERIATEEEAKIEASRHQLQENEISNAPFPEITRDGARSYINGNINFATSIAYQQIYNYVRNRPENSERNRARGHSAQPIVTVADPSGGGSGPDGMPVGKLVGRTGQPGGIKNHKGVDILPVGEGSDTVLRGETSGNDGLPSGSDGRSGSGRTGRDGSDVRKRERESGSGRVVGENREQGANSSHREIEECLDEIRSLLADFENAGKKSLSLSVVGMNAEQIEIAGKILVAGVRLGYTYVRTGITKFGEWTKAMRGKLASPLSASMKLTDAEIDEFITDMWEYPHTVDGETRLLKDWASVLEKEKLRQNIAMTLEEKRKAQQAAEPIPVKTGDLGNIAQTLPFLLPQQQDDVLKAETQFFDESHNDREHAFGKGYMFTNGTGTGKTYTGLGIVKRFVKQGKGRILILTPSQQKVKDWVKDAANLGIELNDLGKVAKARNDGTTATTEKGEGAVITTYANFRQNKALLEDRFDLIVYDESHRLLENKEGAGTTGALQHYKISNRNENYAYLRLQEINPTWKDHKVKTEEFETKRNAVIERLKKESGLTNELALGQRFDLPPVLNGHWTEETERKFPELSGLRKEALALYEKFQKEVKPELERQAKEDVKHTKVVFLSATPFNTRENLDYAEGYIFSYPEREKQDGYGAQSPRSQFYLEHFGAGYRWRYHRLESSGSNPEAVSKQEVEFSDYLQHTLGTMSGRIIDSPFDYSRDFPTVTLDKAEEFNSAMEELSREEATRDGYHKVMGDYNYTSALFESMKVWQIIPRLRGHLSWGRKAVIFHRRMESKKPLVPPFKAIFDESVKALEEEYDANKKAEKKRKIAFLRRKYAGMLEWEQGLDLRMPREQLADAFGKDEVVFFSGQESEKVKNKAVSDFNSDDSGKDIIVIQENSGKEGISLHDTTGRHQRVLVTLALPQSPITALQIEGRIYRIGNKSNAIFEYPLLGLNAELMLFGQKFNQQVSTTENLALGSQARNLRESFSRGVEEHSGDVDPDRQGVGGKEFDAPVPMEGDAFDRAVLDYYTNQKLTGKRDNREGKDYYPTPEPLGYMIAQWGRIGEGESVLEPSAGHGAIARYVPHENPLTAIEPSQSLFGKLQLKAGGNGRRFENGVFEDYNVVNKHDVVLMNPPFGTGGRLAVDHVAKAFQHLEEGGRIVAIIPRGSTDKKFDQWYEGQKDAVVTAEIGLPDITFERAGTSVNCRVVVIDKVGNETLRQHAASRAEHVDLSGEHYEKIEDFFEEIRGINVPERTIDRKAKLKKKAVPTARELRATKGINSVRLDESGLYISGRGVWAEIEWGERQGEELTSYLAGRYRAFKSNYDYAVRGERATNEAVYGELKALACKLAGMTEDEMQRYIDRSGKSDDVLYRNDEVKKGFYRN